MSQTNSEPRPLVAVRKPTHEQFMALAALEPRLLELLDSLKPWQLGSPTQRQILARWYGYREYRGRGLKDEVCKLVGWGASTASVELSTSRAYDTAYHYLFNRLAGLQ